MYKLFGILKRPEGVSLEEFHRWWLEEHATLVKRFPGLKKYTINLTTSGDQRYDGVAEVDQGGLPSTVLRRYERYNWAGKKSRDTQQAALLSGDCCVLCESSTRRLIPVSLFPVHHHMFLGK